MLLSTGTHCFLFPAHGSTTCGLPLLLVRPLPAHWLLGQRFCSGPHSQLPWLANRVSLQGEGAMTAVFWTGLAVWLLFAVAPVRYFLGLVPRRRR